MDRWFDFGEEARLDLVDRRDGVPFTRLTLRDEQSSATIEGAVAAGWIVHENRREFDHYANLASIRAFIDVLKPFFPPDRLLDALTDAPRPSPLAMHTGDLAGSFQGTETSPSISDQIGPDWSAASVSEEIWQDHIPPFQIRELVQRVRDRVPVRAEAAQAFLSRVPAVIDWLERAAALPGVRQFTGELAESIHALTAAADAYDEALERLSGRAAHDLTTFERLSLARALEQEMISLEDEHVGTLARLDELGGSMLAWIDPRHKPSGDWADLVQAARSAYRNGPQTAEVAPSHVPAGLHNVAARVERAANLASPEPAKLPFVTESVAILLAQLDREMTSAKGAYRRGLLEELEETALQDWSGPVSHENALRLADRLRESAKALDPHFSPARVAMWMKDIGGILERTSQSGARISTEVAEQIASQLRFAGELLFAGEKSVPEALRSAEFGVSIVRGIAAAGAQVPPENLAIAREQLEHIAAVLSDGRYLARDVRAAREMELQRPSAAPSRGEVVEAVRAKWQGILDGINRSLDDPRDDGYISEDSYATRNERRLEISFLSKFIARLNSSYDSGAVDLSVKIVDYGYDFEEASADASCGLEYVPEFERKSEEYDYLIARFEGDIQTLRDAGISVATGIVALSPPEPIEDWHDEAMTDDEGNEAEAQVLPSEATEPVLSVPAPSSDEAGPETDPDRRLNLSISALSEDLRNAIILRVKTAQRALGFGKSEPSGPAVAPFGGGALHLWRKLLPVVDVGLATAGVAQGLQSLKAADGRFQKFEALLLEVADRGKSAGALADAIDDGILNVVQEYVDLQELLRETMPEQGLLLNFLAEECARGLPVFVLDGYHRSEGATRDALRFAGLEPGDPSKPVVKLLGPQMTTPVVAEGRHRLATTLSFMQRQFGFAYEGGLSHMFGGKPLDVCFIRDVATVSDAAGRLRAGTSLGRAEHFGQATLTRLSPMAHGAGIHELAHAMDFARADKRQTLHGMMHDTGVVSSVTHVVEVIGAVLHREGPEREHRRAYLLDPMEIFARAVCEGMKASLPAADTFAMQAGGAFGMPMGFDFAPLQSASAEFVRALADEFGAERTLSRTYGAAAAPSLGM